MSDANDKQLITADEKPVIVQLAADGSATGQRARALLALDAGATLEEAAEQSGLTPNQVIYWRGPFRTRRLTVFPDDLVAAATQAASQEMTEPELATTAPESEPKKKKTKKGKKEKKGAKKKGKKKGAKGKKSKK